MSIVASLVGLYRKHRELAGVALVTVVANLGSIILNQSAIPPIVAARGWTTDIGWIFAVWLVAETIAKTPMGALADLIGMRVVYIISSAVGAVSAFLWTVTGVFGIILAIRITDGLASAGAWTVSVLAMGGTVTAKARTGAMGLFMVTYLAALAFAPLLGGYANDATGSKLTSFYLASIFLAISAVLAAIFVPVHPHSEETHGPMQTRHLSLLGEIWLGIRALPEFMLIAFVAFFSIGLLVPIMKLFVMQDLGLDETDYGFMVLPVVGTHAAIALLSGKISGFLGKDHAVQSGLIISAIAMLMIPWIHKPWELGVLAFLVGLGFVIGMPAWLALISDMSAPEVRGTVIGAVGTGQGFGLFAGVALGGYLYTLHPIRVIAFTVPTHHAQFWVAAFGLSLCFVLAVLFIREGTGRYISADVE